MAALALMVWDLWCFEDFEEKERLDQSISKLMNGSGVCRTSPATPDLLKSVQVVLAGKTIFCRKRHFLCLPSSSAAGDRPTCASTEWPCS